MDRKANASPSGMDSTKHGTLTGQDSTTNCLSQSIRNQQSFFKKNGSALDRTPEYNQKTRQSKPTKVANGADADRREGKMAAQEYEIKFTNKARPRCLPVKSSIFDSNKQLNPFKESKTPEIQIQSHDLEDEETREKISIEIAKKSYGNMKAKTILKNPMRNRPKSVRDCLESRFEEKQNMLEAGIGQQIESRNDKERIREKSVPKLTISFNNRRVSVETSRGRESSQKTFLKNIQTEITKYTIKKSQKNSESSVDCFSNGGIRKNSVEKGGSRNFPMFPRKLKHTKSARHRSPDQLSIRSKGSMLSKQFDPQNLLRLFGSPSVKVRMETCRVSQTSLDSSMVRDQGVDLGVVKPANMDKVGDPIDNAEVSEVAFQNLSISKGHDKPIYLESENKWFENMKLLRFYQKYDQESL